MELEEGFKFSFESIIIDVIKIRKRLKIFPLKVEFGFDWHRQTGEKAPFIRVQDRLLHGDIFLEPHRTRGTQVVYRKAIVSPMGSMNVRAGFLLKGLWDRQPSPFVGLSYNIGGQNNVAQLTNGNGVDFRTRVPLAKKFEVEVEGVEQTRFFSDGNNGYDSVSDGRERWGRNELFRAVIPLNLMEQKLSTRRGQFQFPFTFQLPTHIPPSFAYRYGEIMAKVEYKVSVILQQNASVTNWTGRAVATTDLTVLSPQLPHSGRNPLERYAEQPVSDCCGCSVCCGDCCVRGRVGSHVGVDADYIATGGSVGTYSLIWNGTTVPVHGTLRLTRKMRVLDRHGCYRDQQEHLWSHHEGPIGSMLGSSEMHRMASRAFVPGSGNSAVDTPSIETGLIQCKYEVQSVVRPSSGCCGTRVTAVLPLTVIATPFQEPDFAEPPRPQGWNPQVFDNQALGTLAIAPPVADVAHLPGGVREPLLPPVSQDMSYRITDHALV